MLLETLQMNTEIRTLMNPPEHELQTYLDQGWEIISDRVVSVIRTAGGNEANRQVDLRRETLDSI